MAIGAKGNPDAHYAAMRRSLARHGRLRQALALASIILLTLATATGCTGIPFLSPKVPTPTSTPTVAPSATPVPTNTAESRPTPTPAVTVTKLLTLQPTSSPTLAITQTRPPAPTVTATPTLTATATPTITARIRLLQKPLCANELVRIANLAFHDRTIEFTGTAAIDNFWYYKFEYQGIKETEWHVIGELHYTPVKSGILKTWDTAILPPGVYRVNLIVVDKTGNYPPPCGVQIEILK